MHRLPVMLTKLSTHTHTRTKTHARAHTHTDWFYWSKRQWVAAASAGPVASLHLAPDRQPQQHPTTLFFTGRMPFLPPNQQHQSTEGTTKLSKQQKMRLDIVVTRCHAQNCVSIYHEKWHAAAEVFHSCRERPHVSSNICHLGWTTPLNSFTESAYTQTLLTGFDTHLHRPISLHTV